MSSFPAPTYPGTSAILGDARFDTIVFDAPSTDYDLIDRGPGLVEAVGRGQDVAMITVGEVQFSDRTILIADEPKAETARTYAILGQSVSPNDLRFWQGNGGADSAAHWLLSEQHRSTDPTIFLTDLYRTGLGRAPDVDGIHAWENAMAHGASAESVVLGFANSPEYVAHVAAAGWLFVA